MNLKRARLWAIFAVASFSTVSYAQEVLASFSLIDLGGQVTTSSSVDARLAVDRDLSTVLSFENTEDAWLQFKVPTLSSIKAVSIVNTSSRENEPRWVALKGSNDGQKWTSLTNQTAVAYDQGSQSFILKAVVTKPFTYYRVIFSKRSSDEERPVEIAECQFFGDPVEEYAQSLISNQGKLTGEFEGLANYNEVLPNLIDGDKKTKYTVDKKHLWVEYELPEAAVLRGYSLTNTKDLHNRTPRSWELLGSNDRENWVLLDQQISRSFKDIEWNKQYFRLDNTIDLSKAYDWGAYADQAHEAMQTHFWNAFRRYYIHSYTINETTGKKEKNTGFNYWWNAHNLDALVDGYQRTGDTIYLDRMEALIKGCIVRQQSWVEHGNELENWFFDDMDWMGLSTLRAYQATGDSVWLSRAVKLWESIVFYGWDEKLGGGIYWNKERGGKNACANAPAMILSARLYEETSEERYLDWAIKIHDWTASHLKHEPSGLIYDGIGMDSVVNTNMGWLFTYNQGTYMGGCAYLYRITKDPKYLEEAVTIADIVTNPVDDRYHHYSPGGIMNGGGGGDGGLFDAIFMRYLTQMIQMNILDTNRAKAYTRYLVQNAYSLCKSAIIYPDFAISDRWYARKGIYEQRDGSVHLSGVMLLELVDELERDGYLKGLYNQEQVEANRVEAYKYYRLEVWGNGGDNMTHLSELNLYSDLFDDEIHEKVVSTIYWETNGLNLIVYNKETSEAGHCALYTTDGRKLGEAVLADRAEFTVQTAGYYLLRVTDENGVTTSQIIYLH